MSDTGGTPAGGAPAADGGSAASGPAAATPPSGPRRSAPGLTSDRGGMTLSQGVAALRRGAAPSPAPAADGAPQPSPILTTEPAPPRRRAAPSQPQGANGAAADGGQQQPPQQQQPQRQTAPASAIDAVLAALTGADRGADGGQQQQGSEPQPAPTNAYLQGVPLTIEGQQRHFTVPELTDAVSKASDYTRKTQQLAEQARTINERAQTIDQLLPILIPEIERQLQAMDGGGFAEPDWIALSADPAEYARQNAAWRVHQQQREQERGRLTQIMQANQQREAQQRAERVRVSHAELVRTLPGWGDEKTRNQLIGEMRAWGAKNGFPAAELDQIVEARHIRTIAWAMIGQRMAEGARTATLQVPQVRRGGAPAAPAPAAVRNAEERFAATPNVKSGVGLLMARRAAQRGNGAAR